MAVPVRRHLRLGCEPGRPLTARRVLSRALLALVIVGAFVVLLGLGTWQVQRLHWKEALIAAATERPIAPAVAPPGPAAWDDFSLDDWNYRRVRLSGAFAGTEAYQWIALTEPKGPRGGPGYMVLAPFTTDEGWTVLVNRGFVPEDAFGDPSALAHSPLRSARSEREEYASESKSGAISDRSDDPIRAESALAPPSGPSTVEGIIRSDDPPNFATPAPDPDRDVFFSRDIGAIGAALAVDGPIAPYQIDLVASETPPSGLPQAGESRITFPNSHLQYALTWYGLAVALAGVVAASLWRRRGPIRANQRV